MRRPPTANFSGGLSPSQGPGETPPLAGGVWLRSFERDATDVFSPRDSYSNDPPMGVDFTHVSSVSLGNAFTATQARVLGAKEPKNGRSGKISSGECQKCNRILPVPRLRLLRYLAYRLHKKQPL